VLLITYGIFVSVVLLFLVTWLIHQRTLRITKKKFYSKQVSVADFTLKANIKPNVWLPY
jgi:hypothetical protein